jgi:Tfp pilus assembly protein PilZ
VTLTRIGDEPRGVRRVRLRADDTLARRMGPAALPNEVARLRIPTREAAALGDRIIVELSFGPMVDEIEIDGDVVAITPDLAGGPASIELAFDRRHKAQIDYVMQVLGGLRAATARAHRRVPVDLGVAWRCGELAQQTRARDLSRGGAFLLSHLQPVVGAAVDLEFQGDHDTPILRLAATVSWVQRQGRFSGFGVRLHVRTREESEVLATLIRKLSSPPAER